MNRREVHRYENQADHSFPPSGGSRTAEKRLRTRPRARCGRRDRDMTPVWLAWIQALGVPSLFASLMILWMQRIAKKRDAQEREREAARQKNNVLLIRMVGASIALGEATAHAVQLGHPNGDIETALACARQVKEEQKDFLTEQAQKNIS